MRFENLSVRPSAGPRNYDADIRRMGMRVDALTEKLGEAMIRIAELEKANAKGGVITSAAAITGKKRKAA